MLAQVLHAKDRAETKERLADEVASDGPYQALVIKMGTVCPCPVISIQAWVHS